MIRRAVELILIAAVLVGGVLAWRTGRERARLGSEYARLARLAGDFEIADTTKAHVLALDTGEALNYAWRVYLPPNYNLIVRSTEGGSSSTTSNAEDIIIRIRIRPESNQDQGQYEIFENFGHGSGRSGFGDQRLAGLIRGHEREIVVEQLGAGKVAVVEPDQNAVLLRLKLPANLEAKARETLGADIGQFSPDLYFVEFGPKAASPGSKPQ